MPSIRNRGNTSKEDQDGYTGCLLKVEPRFFDEKLLLTQLIKPFI